MPWRKISKLCVSVLLAASMDDLCKLLPFVVGKGRSPGCFMNVKSIPVRYASHKIVWMTLNLFTDCFHACHTELEDVGTAGFVFL